MIITLIILLFCIINIKNSPKTNNKASINFKCGEYFHYGGRMMIFSFEEVPRVCYTLPKQPASYIQYWRKNDFSKYCQKIDFFQNFQTFHKDLSQWSYREKDFLNRLLNENLILHEFVSIVSTARISWFTSKTFWKKNDGYIYFYNYYNFKKSTTISNNVFFCHKKIMFFMYFCSFQNENCNNFIWLKKFLHFCHVYFKTFGTMFFRSHWVE